MKRKLCSVILCSLTLISMTIPSMASSVVNASQAEASIESMNTIPIDNIAVSDELSGLARGTSKPTKEWDFTNDGPYVATVTDLRGATLYTNYYFTDASIIYGRVAATTDSGNATLYVQLYDLTDNYYAASTSLSVNNLWGDPTVDGFSEGCQKEFTFRPLNTSHKYAVIFTSGNHESGNCIRAKCILSDIFSDLQF